MVGDEAEQRQVEYPRGRPVLQPHGLHVGQQYQRAPLLQINIPTTIYLIYDANAFINQLAQRNAIVNKQPPLQYSIGFKFKFKFK